MSVMHTWPAELGISDLSVGMTDEALVTKLGTGATISRSYQTRPKRTISGRLSIMRAQDWAGSRRQERLECFLEQVRGRLTPFYFLEPYSCGHRRVYMGTGDGTQTAFSYGFQDDVGVAQVQRDGYPVTPNWTSTRSNLLTDNQANCVLSAMTGVTYYHAYVLAASDQMSLDGLSSFYVGYDVPTSGTKIFQTLATMPAVTAGRVYTGMVSSKGSGTHRCVIEWYQSDRSTPCGTATTDGTSGTGSTSEWTQFTATGTAPSGAAYARVALERTTSSDTLLFAACFGLCPGSWSEWILPSVSPKVAVFTTAPTAGQELRATIYGDNETRRLTRVRFAADCDPWSLLSFGGTRGGGFRLVEDWEPT